MYIWGSARGSIGGDWSPGLEDCLFGLPVCGHVHPEDPMCRGRGGVREGEDEEGGKGGRGREGEDEEGGRGREREDEEGEREKTRRREGARGRRRGGREKTRKEGGIR